MNHLTRNTLGAAFVAAISAGPGASAAWVYFMGEGPNDSWQNPANWSPSLPAGNDIVRVGETPEAQNSFVHLDASVFDLATLDITDGMVVRTNGHLLYLGQGALNLSDMNQDEQNENVFYPSRLIVENASSDLDAWFEYVDINSNAALVLEDGAKVQIDNNLQSDPTCGTYGVGTWSFVKDNAFQISLDNRGYISGQPGVSVVEQLGASKFDLDGNNPGETGRVNASIASGSLGATLIFNGTALADDFDGDMTINFNGRIEMNFSSDWTLGSDGLLRFGAGTDNETPTLAGSTMTVLGEIDANARNSVIEANVWIQNGSHTTVATNDALTFTGNTIAQSALFTVNDGGTLDFAGPLNATGNGFDLFGGTMTGGIIQNTGGYGIRGYGTVNNRVINDAVLYADGGTLLVNGTHNDWDGIGNAGELRAWGGDLHLTDTQDFSFAGDMRAYPGDEIFIDGFSFELAASGYMYLWNATLRATDPVTVAGAFDALGSDAGIDAIVDFTSTSVTVVGDRLNLLQNATVRPGASILGAPDTQLVNTPSGQINLMHGSAVDVTVSGQGLTLVEGALTGNAYVNGDYLNIGTLALQIGPPVPLQFDRLIVSDTFEARGDIEVTTFGYQPQLGDEWDVLDFSTFVDLGYVLDLPPLSADLDWDTSDFETDGILRVDVDTCPADVNDDGWVDFADILLVIGAWETPNAAMDVDQNGLVGFSDLLEIIAAWGACP